MATTDIPDLHALAARQRSQAVAWTQRDVWLTAAFMTLLLGPFGVLFGAASLISMRGLRRAISEEQTEISARRLRRGRLLVLVGLGLSVCLNLAMLVRFYMTYSAMAAEFRPPAQEASDGN
ncbi:MAG: hypothetical protein ABI548_21265 [Polyangiaceae bacterium]